MSTSIAPERRSDSNQTLLFILVASGVMLFATFTASLLVRRGGADWRPLPMPAILWANTAVLLLSSATMEVARRKLDPRPWLVLTAVLGLAFAGGQFLAWRDLAARGVFLGTQPHGSFFYMLTGVHAAHLLAGLVVLAWAVARRTHLELCSVWWHFVGGLWLYLLVMLWVL